MLHKLVHRPHVASDNPPLLVLMHGLGADERDLMGLASGLDPRLMIVSLRAPRQCEYGGFAWFDVSWDAEGVHVDEVQALESRAVVLETLKALPGELGVGPSQIFLGGFSQGAMMSLGVALSAPELPAGVLLLSGRLLPAFAHPEASTSITHIPFLVQHGTLDPVLPVVGSREIKAYLEGLGCSVSYHEYPMGHEISQESLDDARGWLTGCIE